MREYEPHAAQLHPCLIDATGAVSRTHGVLGKGMRLGLPGHGFVLIDAHGTEGRYGEYPSTYLCPPPG